MLTIICCSVNKVYLDKLKLSIDNFSDIDTEFLFYNNLGSNLSIASVYNKLAKKSRFDNLLFIHEDVEFISPNWGLKLMEILKNKIVGVVGIAGSTYLPAVPSGWYLPDENLNNVYIHQGFKYSKKEIRFDNQGKDITEVYLLDGVFLAMRKEVWQQFPFNENLKGFHAYDVDICQRVSSKFQNIFTNQIELLHHSEGKVDKKYFDAILQYKRQFLNFNYSKRDVELECQLLEQFYTNLRCYYDVDIIKNKLLPFVKVNYLGWKGYFRFMFKLRYGK